ncbi:hypothetical protein Q3G72_019304 [Acer saccharum]|nr:hypothetical protein Q3G72_019304 [Acer saccharum]
MITINMYGTWTILAVVFALLFFLQSLLWKRNAKTKRLPPGPRGFPIFGCLHLLGKFPHRDLHKLSQKYGPIMHLRLGLKPTVVASSPQAAELFLKNYDQVFASRPPLLASKHFSYGQQALIFGPYGPHWRNMRKMCTSELLCSQKISSFKSIRKEELDLLIESVKQQAGDHHVVDLSGKVKSFTVDVICRMLFRRKYVDEIDEIGFQSLLREVLIWVGTPNIADYIPQIAFLDPNGLIKHMKAISKVLDEFFEKIIEERLQSKDENRTKDFVDIMLGFMESEESEYRIQRHHVKAIMLLLPFGSGRRACAGIQMGFLEVRLLVAQLVHCFDWELPDGMLPNELDMTEGFSQVIFRANPLRAIPTNYRLNI